MTRLLTFIMVALFSLWMGLFCFRLEHLHYIVIYLSYPFLLTAFVLFFWGVYQFHRGEEKLTCLLPRKRSALILMTAIAAMLVLMEPMEFKVVYDELVLAVTSQMIHFNRLSGMPRQGHDYFGSYMLLDSVLDKRPLFFPFLTSLVHDLTGFRYQNAFYLNAALTAALTTLLYGFSRLLSGHRAALLSVALLGTLPLLGIYASSGHFEVLNLLMILIVAIFAYFYIDKPNEARLIPLVFSLILLTQVRYESSLYLLPFGILILLGWRKAGRVILPRQVILAPLLLVVYLLHLRLIQTSTENFFQEGPNGRLSTFSSTYLAENLSSAFAFFFAVTMKQANSFLLSALGFTATAFFLGYAWKRSRKLSGAEARGTTLFFLMIGMGIFCCLVAFFNFGLFSEYITARLSLPIHLFWVLLIPFVLARYGRNFIKAALLIGMVCAVIAFSGFDRERIIVAGGFFSTVLLATIGFLFWNFKYARQPRLAFLTLPLFWTLTITLPVAHSRVYSEQYLANDMIMAELEFVREHAGKERMMLFTSSPYTGMLEEVNTAHLDLLNLSPSIAQKHLEKKHYDNLYAFIRRNRADDGSLQAFGESDKLAPDLFVTEVAWEKRIRNSAVVTAYRILEVYPPEVEPEEESEADASESAEGQESPTALEAEEQQTAAEPTTY